MSDILELFYIYPAFDRNKHSKNACAKTQATAASPTTLAAGTAQTSDLLLQQVNLL